VNAAVQRCDEAIFRLVNHGCANPLGDALFPIFNHAAPFLLPALVLAAWLAWRHSPRAWRWALALLLGVALGDSLLFNPLKHLLARPRPAATLPDVRALAPGATGGWSLPSSHTANAFLAAAMLAAALPRWRTGIYVLAGLVGFSRVYVGVHYPLDATLSALLGWGLGKGGVGLGRQIQSRRRRLPFPSSPARIPASNPWNASREPYPTLLLFLTLLAIQAARLLWAALTPLDVPVAEANRWLTAFADERDFFANLARTWFRLWDAAPLSLWAIPWIFQTTWLLLLAGIARLRGGRGALAAVLLLSLTVPLVSQLSFSGAPAQIFRNADWAASDCVRALLFYLLLGLPLWIAAAANFRRHPFVSGLALAGWLLGASLPHLSWDIVALCASGTMLHLALRFGKAFRALAAPNSRGMRVALLLLTLYGLLLSACVYQPRLLRKLDLSLLPRNSPYYGQTGYGEYLARIRPHLDQRPEATLFLSEDSSASLIRYLLRDPRPERVRLLERDPHDTPPRRGDFYLREVDFAQINPRVIFLARDKALLRRFAGRLEELDSTEIFRNGDPIRQFQLWELREESSAAPR